MKNLHIKSLLALVMLVAIGCAATPNGEESSVEWNFTTLGLDYEKGFTLTSDSRRGTITVNADDLTISYHLVQGNDENDLDECTYEAEISENQLEQLQVKISTITSETLRTQDFAGSFPYDDVVVDGDEYTSDEESCNFVGCNIISEEDHCDVKTLIKKIVDAGEAPDCADLVTDTYSLMVGC